VLFVGDGTEVYEGMMVGEHSRDNDLDVNCVREKKLTNMRASGSDDAVRLVPFKNLTLEQSIEFIADDELVEVTPKSLRMRKRILQSNRRESSRRDAPPQKVAMDELLLAVVFEEGNHLGWFGHLLPSPRDQFGGLKIRLIRQKLRCAYMAILLAEEPEPIELSPLV
jgi:hypothetical protein